MSYLALKHLHISCVILSGLGFVLRAWWMWSESPMSRRRWAKITPHVIDTLLLGSALSMAYLSSQYPFVDAWLTAKFFGLLAYILFGTVALKRGRTRAIRARFAGLAIFCYAYIVSVALTRQVLPWV